MRRSFTLATAFTGVAALSGGHAPAALAATTPTTAVHPDIGNRVCGANNGGGSGWAHLYQPSSGGVASACGRGPGPRCRAWGG